MSITTLLAQIKKGWENRKVETTPSTMYRNYRVDLGFIDGLAGGKPATKFLAVAHAAKFAAEVTNALKLSKKNEGDVSDEAVETYLEQLSSVFAIDEEGVYIEGNNFLAMLKDAGQRTKMTMKQKGLGNSIRDGGLVFPRKVHLGVNPTFAERPVKPENGPSNIKRYQLVEDLSLSIPFSVLQNGDISDKAIKELWRAAQNIGLGANRHLMHGHFIVLDIREEAGWSPEQVLRGVVPVVTLDKVDLSKPGYFESSDWDKTEEPVVVEAVASNGKKRRVN